MDKHMPKSDKVAIFAQKYRGVEQMVACHFDLVEVGDSSSPAATLKIFNKR